MGVPNLEHEQEQRNRFKTMLILRLLLFRVANNLLLVWRNIPMIESETNERDEVAWQNATALAELQKTYGLFIPPSTYKNWRPTQRIAGDIPGVRDNLVCIATDGLMGYFLSEWDSERPVFYGHVTSFLWHENIESILPYVDKATGTTKFFRSIRRSGRPPTLFRTERKRTIEEDIEFEKTKTKPKRMSPLEQAMELLRTLKEKV